MKIGIDFINLNHNNLGGGLGRYALQLIEGLSNIDKENEYVLFINKSVLHRIHINNPKFHLEIIKVPRRRYAPWNQIYFLFHRKLIKSLNLLHSPVTPSPLFLFVKTKTMVTLHDLAWKFFPETFRPVGVAWWSFAWPRSLKKSRHIIVDSENTKEDVIKIYKIQREKITVIYPYTSFHLSQISPQTISDVVSKYNLPEKYILSVGVSHKRKNLDSLIKALQILKKEKNIPHKLVLTGPRGWGMQDLVEKIALLGLQKEVIFTENIFFTDMPSVYSKADAFVFPSLYEGFGYPPLEAMACGTPVVVSKNSSLPEVVGNAGIYIENPLNPKEIADKIMQIISSPDLTRRLREAGFEQSKKFTVEEMIKKHIEIYNKYGHD
jgi:glycosyltransferase involved in cell wall biosynthesis